MVEHLLLELPLLELPVASSCRSASVLSPWSMWALIERLRIRLQSMLLREILLLPAGPLPATLFRRLF